MESMHVKNDGDGGSVVESQFQRVPMEMKYKIFARTGLRDFAACRCVSKEWNNLLSPSALKVLKQSLSRIHITRSPAFLIAITPYLPMKDLDHKHYEHIQHFASVDEKDARMEHLDMLNIKNLTDWGSWTVSCNGLVVALPDTEGPPIEIVVCNPSLRWLEKISWTLTSSPCIPESVCAKGISLVGVSFDPSTSDFTLLTAFTHIQKATGLTRYELHLYNSKVREWRTVKASLQGHFLPQHGPEAMAVFSEGAFFWMEEEDDMRSARVAILDMSNTEKVYTMPLPECRVDNHTKCVKNEYPPVSWKLKGCDGNVVMVHYYEKVQQITLWRVMKISTGGWGYEQLVEQGTGLNQHGLNLNPCLGWPRVDTNRDGWWLWATTDHYQLKESMGLFDDQGKIRHIVPFTHFFPFLQISPKYEVMITKVLAFETDNFWEVLASS